MPWKESSVTSERVRFILEYQKQVLGRVKSMAQLCAEFGISRKAGYENLARYHAGGLAGLADRSRAPLSGDHWADPDLIARVLSMRQEWDWGAKKIRQVLIDDGDYADLPAVSTMHDWIKKADLITTPTPQRRFSHPGPPSQEPIVRPNQLWRTDFKGQYRLRNGKYCYALTVTDAFSRYLIAVRALPATTFELTKRAFERIFEEFGVPEAILSDTGSPFASNSVRRFSALSVWWIRAQIEPRLTEPGRPQQNGSHERMHREFKRIVCRTPSSHLRAEQGRCDEFVRYYNDLRPNESINQTRPARLYTPSERPYSRRLREIEYPVAWDVRRVRSSGEIRWKGQWFYLSDPLAGQQVAFEKVDDTCSILRFAKYELGYYSDHDAKLHLDRPRPKTPADPN